MAVVICVAIGSETREKVEVGQVRRGILTYEDRRAKVFKNRRSILLNISLVVVERALVTSSL